MWRTANIALPCSRALQSRVAFARACSSRLTWGFWLAVAVVAIGAGFLSVLMPALVAVSTEYSGASKSTGASLMGFTNQSSGALGAAFGGVLLASAGLCGHWIHVPGGDHRQRADYTAVRPPVPRHHPTIRRQPRLRLGARRFKQKTAPAA